MIVQGHSPDNVGIGIILLCSQPRELHVVWAVWLSQTVGPGFGKFSIAYADGIVGTSLPPRMAGPTVPGVGSRESRKATDGESTSDTPPAVVSINQERTAS